MKRNVVTGKFLLMLITYTHLIYVVCGLTLWVCATMFINFEHAYIDCEHVTCICILGQINLICLHLRGRNWDLTLIQYLILHPLGNLFWSHFLVDYLWDRWKPSFKEKKEAKNKWDKINIQKTKSTILLPSLIAWLPLDHHSQETWQDWLDVPRLLLVDWLCNRQHLEKWLVDPPGG